MSFDRVAMLDWSGGNDTGPRPRRDAIWLGEAGAPPRYLRNRQEAEAALAGLIEEALARRERLFLGVDFPFGYPSGFARVLTGEDDPLAVWRWLEAHLEDGPRGNNRFELAGRINRLFPGIGPFWFNPTGQDVPDLPRRDLRQGHGMAERRSCEMRAGGTFTCWQLGGAGAVGSQVLTGLPVLARLKARFGGDIAVWPFEPWQKAGVVLVEVWPSLVNDVVKRAESQGGIRDAHQVALLARAVAGLPEGDLEVMLDIDAPEEGWIFGLGHEDTLRRAAETPLDPPPLRNDCFALPAGVDWTPVDAALGMLRDRLRRVVGKESLPLMQAAGRVLAEDLVAKRSNPPHPNTAVDGYGFSGEVPDEAPRRMALVAGRAAAGAPFAGTVPEGQALRVLTGAELPDGVDTVVLDEDVTVGSGEIAFRGPLKRGANTRRAGEDVAEGAVALRAGRVLTPADLALAAAVGHGAVPVYRRLRVAVLSTGDEIVDPGQDAAAGQIHDANRPMLLSLCQGFGFEALDIGRAPDDRGRLAAMLNEAAARADVILTSGGASAGDEDHMSALLREAGAMQEWRIALKPGRPLALGVWKGVPVFGLPGNPVAALVCTLVFARPAMGVLAGARWAEPQGFEVPAGFEKHKKPGRREYLRARMRNGAAEVFKSEGSGRISGLSWAEGLVELPDGAVHVRPGDPVRYIPYGSFDPRYG